jgi:hypothetical protein
MALAVETTFDNPDPDACPQTYSELVADLRTLVHSTFNGSFIPYVTGAATPPVEDQDKVWHKLDSTGRPIGTFIFYQGTWRKQYDHRINEIVFYSGDPAVDFAGSGHKGTVGGEWDGFQLCTGENNSPNLSDKFIVGAKMDDLAIGYTNGDGPWQTTVQGSTHQFGGVKDITLDAATTYETPHAATNLHRRTADGETPDATGGLFGFGPEGQTEVTPAFAGNTTPNAIPTVPPYYAFALAIFFGYD